MIIQFNIWIRLDRTENDPNDLASVLYIWLLKFIGSISSALVAVNPGLAEEALNHIRWWSQWWCWSGIGKCLYFIMHLIGGLLVIWTSFNCMALARSHPAISLILVPSWKGLLMSWDPYHTNWPGLLMHFHSEMINLSYLSDEFLDQAFFDCLG